MYKMILVDDDDIIRDGLISLLEWDDYEVEIVGSFELASTAISFMESNLIDIVITDVCMPEQNGIQLIEWTKEHIPSVKCIVISGYNDFEYVKQAARFGIENYILKPIDDQELKNTLISTIQKIDSETSLKQFQSDGLSVIRNNILSRLIYNEIDEYELFEKAPFIGFNLTALEYVLCSVRTVAGSTAYMDYTKLITDYLKVSIDVPSYCFADLSNNYILIFTSTIPLVLKSKIKQVLNNLLNYLEKHTEAKSFITVSDYLSNYRLLADAYKTVKHMQNYALVYPDSTLLFEKDIQEQSTRTPSLAIQQPVIDKCIQDKTPEALCDYIQKIFLSFHQNYPLNIEFIQNTVADFMLCFISSIRSLDYCSYEAFSNYQGVFTDIFKLFDVKELEKWLIHTVMDCFSTLHVEDKNANHIIQNILDYVEKNYNQDINLKTIAFEFNMNAFYLGQIFKDATGENFTQYLNSYRIEKAKKLLQTGKYKVNVVAEKTGYLNTNYFYTIFKKKTGMSPAQYAGL